MLLKRTAWVLAVPVTCLTIGFFVVAHLSYSKACSVKTRRVATSLTSELPAASLSDYQRRAAVMFIKSQDVPKLFEACKNVEPDRSATYDAVWKAWQHENRAKILQGEKIFRAASLREGKDPDAYLKHEVEILPAAIHQMTHAEQVERCTHALDSLLKES